MHKFRVGQIVQFLPLARHFSNVTPGPYEITKQMPFTGGEFEYHIKSSKEAHERIAKESQLTGL